MAARTVRINSLIRTPLDIRDADWCRHGGIQTPAHCWPQTSGVVFLVSLALYLTLFTLSRTLACVQEPPMSAASSAPASGCHFRSTARRSSRVTPCCRWSCLCRRAARRHSTTYSYEYHTIPTAVLCCCVADRVAPYEGGQTTDFVMCCAALCCATWIVGWTGMVATPALCWVGGALLFPSTATRISSQAAAA